MLSKKRYEMASNFRNLAIIWYSLQIRRKVNESGQIMCFRLLLWLTSKNQLFLLFFHKMIVILSKNSNIIEMSITKCQYIFYSATVYVRSIELILLFWWVLYSLKLYRKLEAITAAMVSSRKLLHWNVYPKIGIYIWLSLG